MEEWMDFQSLKVDEQLNDNDFKLDLERKEVKMELVEIIGEMNDTKRRRESRYWMYILIRIKRCKKSLKFKITLIYITIINNFTYF